MTRAVVGLDLSLTSTGIVVDSGGAPWCGTIRSSGAKGDPWSARWCRMGDIASRVLAVVPEQAFVVVEAPSYGSTTGSQHDRSGLWWVVYDLLAGSARTVVPVQPTMRAKYATGKGNAKKDSVLAAVVRRYPDIDIDGHDIADAVVLMAIGHRLLGHPIDDPMPALNLSALTKLRVPEEAGQA